MALIKYYKAKDVTSATFFLDTIRSRKSNHNCEIEPPPPSLPTS